MLVFMYLPRITRILFQCNFRTSYQIKNYRHIPVFYWERNWQYKIYQKIQGIYWDVVAVHSGNYTNTGINLDFTGIETDNTKKYQELSGIYCNVVATHPVIAQLLV